MLDILAARDSARPARQTQEQAESQAAQDARTTLAVMNSLGSLGVQVFLDKQDPLFKRDLSGDARVWGMARGRSVCCCSTPPRASRAGRWSSPPR